MLKKIVTKNRLLILQLPFILLTFYPSVNYSARIQRAFIFMPFIYEFVFIFEDNLNEIGDPKAV